MSPNVEKLKTSHFACLHQGRSNFFSPCSQKESINTPQITTATQHTHTKEQLARMHSHLFPRRFAKPCLNSPITMTTSLSLLAVPVGGFRPAFSNFTLCGYLHSVITIPSILIFPVQTMCPGYTKKNKKSLACVHTYTHIKLARTHTV